MSLRKELLPLARTFYRRALEQLTTPDRRGWMKASCRFHKSKRGKPFSVHIGGHFFCCGCKVEGGGPITFLRLRDGIGFKDACKLLGAWQEGQKRRAKPRLGPLVPFLTMDFVVDGIEYHASVED